MAQSLQLSVNPGNEWKEVGNQGSFRLIEHIRVIFGKKTSTLMLLSSLWDF